MIEIIYTGGTFSVPLVKELTIGEVYLLKGNKVYNKKMNMMITVTAQDVITCFDLVI